MAALYFWSLHGAWAIITDQLGGDSRKHYHYLYERMFPVYLDDCYAWALGLYFTFVVVVALMVLFTVRSEGLPTANLHPVRLSHDRIIALCGLAAAASFWIMHDSIGGALQNGKSAYVVTRWETDDLGLFRIHQVLNRVALVPAALGFATLLSSGQCRMLAGPKRTRHLVGYLLLLGFMFALCVVLGNKNELALALFSACFFYLANSTRPHTKLLLASGVVMLAGVAFIDFVRALSIDEIADNISIGEISNSLLRLAESNEAFGSHMSLYGTLRYELPFTYGSSFYIFIVSMVPRAFWPTRPDDIYWYYANGVGLTSIAEGQGYTIHHATGWYLNFGIPGVIIGACLLGRVWALLYNVCVKATYRRGASLGRIFCSVGFFTFSANLPTLIRSGPEGYKGILVDSLIVPVAVLVLARLPQHSAYSAPLAMPRRATSRRNQRAIAPAR
jgi:oligosaccharide repeat unit polymerase